MVCPFEQAGLRAKGRALVALAAEMGRKGQARCPFDCMARLSRVLHVRALLPWCTVSAATVAKKSGDESQSRVAGRCSGGDSNEVGTSSATAY
jgi:hypothetical protein